MLTGHVVLRMAAPQIRVYSSFCDDTLAGSDRRNLPAPIRVDAGLQCADDRAELASG